MFGRAFDKVKSVARNAWGGIKRYFQPASYSAGQVIGSASGVVLYGQKLADKSYQSFTDSPADTPAPQNVKIPFVLYLVASNVCLNILSRLAPLVYTYREPDSDFTVTTEPTGEPINFLSREEHARRSPSSESSWINRELGIGWNAFLIYVRVMLYSSMMWSFNSAIFGMIKFFEFSAELYTGNASPKLSDALIVLEAFLTLYVAFGNAQSFRSFRIPRAIQHLTQMIKDIKTNGITVDKTLTLVLTLTGFYLIYSMLGGFFTTNNSFIKYKSLSSFIDNLISKNTALVLTLISTKSAFISDLVQKPFQFKSILNKFTNYVKSKWSPEPADIERNAPPKTPLPGYWLKAKKAGYFFAFSEACASGSGCISTVPFFIKQISGMNPDTWAILPFEYFMVGVVTTISLASNLDSLDYSEQIVAYYAEAKAREEKLAEIFFDSESDDEAVPLLEMSSTAKVHSFFDEEENEQFYDVSEEEPIITKQGLLDSESEMESDGEIELPKNRALQDRMRFFPNSESSSDSEMDSDYRKLIKRMGEDGKKYMF